MLAAFEGAAKPVDPAIAVFAQRKHAKEGRELDCLALKSPASAPRSPLSLAPADLTPPRLRVLLDKAHVASRVSRIQVDGTGSAVRKGGRSQRETEFAQR